MEKDAALPNDFPTDGVELRCFLVVSDYTRSLAFYRDVLGATVMRELPGNLCFLRFAGSQILLSAPAGSMKDTPAGSHPPPLDCTSVISELSIRVPDCSAARRGSCALAELSFSLPLSSGATRRGPFSMTLMDISWRSGKCGKLRLEVNEHVCLY